MSNIDKTIYFLTLSLAFFGPLLISPWGFDRSTLIKESFLFVTSGILLILLLFEIAAGRGLSLKGIPLAKPIFLLLAGALLSLLRAVNLPAGVHRLALFLAGFSLYLVVTHARLGREQIAGLAKATVASALVTTSYAFLQYFRLDPFLPPTMVSLPSTLGNANLLAEHLILAIPLCLALSLTSIDRDRYLLRSAATFLFAGLLLCKSKGASLGFFVSLAVFFFLLRRERRPETRAEIRWLLYLAIPVFVIAGIFGLAFFAQFAGPRGASGVLERYIASQEVYIRWRLIFYNDTLRMALDNVPFGVGIGNFQSFYPLYRTLPETLDPTNFILEHAHNDYLELWAELGLAGLIAFLWLLWEFFRRSLQLRPASPLSFGYTAAVAALAANSLFGYGLYNPVPIASLWLFLSLALHPQPQTSAGGSAEVGVAQGRSASIWALVVSLLAIVVLLWASIRPLVADAYLSQGYKLFRQGAANEAVPRLGRAARLSPGRLEAQVYLAEAYFYLRRHKEAVAVLERYLKHDPYNYQVHYLLGLNAEQVGDNVAAIEAYKTASEIFPLYSKPFLRIGLISERRGEFQDAIAAYQKAIRLNPGFAEAANSLAVLLSNQGRLDEAIRVWEEAAKKSPQDLIIAQNLALAYSKKGEGQAARSWMERAERLRSRSRKNHGTETGN